MAKPLTQYLQQGEYIGLDKILLVQRRIDGFIATRVGITALAPMGAMFGFIIAYLIFS